MAPQKLFLVLLNLDLKFSVVRVFSNGSDNHESGSSHELGARHKEGTVLFAVVCARDFLLDGISFSSE